MVIELKHTKMKKLLLLITALFILASAEGQILRHSNYTAPTPVVNNLLTSLIAYWDLDESTGKAIDLHASYDGTLTNAPTQNQSGLLGTSYLFEEDDNEKINCGLEVGDFGTSDCSISAWIKIPAEVTAGDQDAILGKYAGAAPQWYVFITDAELVSLYWRPSGTAVYISSSNSISLDEWVHVVVTMDRDGNATIYINGEADGTPVSISATSADNMDNSVAFILGARYYGADDAKSMDGYLDEVGIWYRVLTQTDIDFLYNSGSGLAYASFK